MREELIAHCGMNCGLCISYQFKENDLNKKGFNRTYCPGCIPRAPYGFHWTSQFHMTLLKRS